MRRYQLKRWVHGHVWLPLLRVCLFLWPRVCSWHKGMYPENWDTSPPSCPECGCLLDTNRCARCGNDFLDFGGRFGDDFLASPSVTSSGDLACCRCAERMEREEEDGADNDSPEYEYDAY